MGRIGTLFAALLLLSAFFWLAETLFAANRGQPRLYRRRGFATDLCYWFATPLVTKAVSQLGLGLILVVIYRQNAGDLRAMLAARDTWLARQPLGLQAVEMLLVGDFIGYWLHRAFHGRALWKFHAIHHCSQDLDWLSSVRLHPENDWLTRWVQASTLVLLGFSPGAIAAYVPFLTFYAVLLHANVSWGFGPLAPLIASPKFHRWHHTSEDEGLDKNFAGLFPIFDVLFGTYYMPTDRLPARFGLKDETVPQKFLAQLAYPFKRARAAAPAPTGAPAG
ncbi:MAG TPA: sterol desaturase family protein [Gammaproteobacteria bacterium]|nr:sterol desaturase family protein [Gammaproteobacteria bacterium]